MTKLLAKYIAGSQGELLLRRQCPRTALLEGLSTPHERCMAKHSVWKTALALSSPQHQKMAVRQKNRCQGVYVRNPLILWSRSVAHGSWSLQWFCKQEVGRSGMDSERAALASSNYASVTDILADMHALRQAELLACKSVNLFLTLR